MINYLADKLKVRKSILLLLLFTLIFSFYNFFVKNEIQHIEETKQSINELEQQLEIIEKKVKTIDSTDLIDMEHRAQEFKKQYDLGLDSQLVLLDINQYSEEASLEILGFQAKDIEDFEDFKHRVYTLVLKGSYENFLNWLRLMEKTPYYINIGDLYISKYEISDEKSKDKTAQEETIFIVSINNIALDGVLNWEENNDYDFRTDPFKPGIGK